MLKMSSLEVHIGKVQLTQEYARLFENQHALGGAAVCSVLINHTDNAEVAAFAAIRAFDDYVPPFSNESRMDFLQGATSVALREIDRRPTV